MEPMTDITI